MHPDSIYISAVLVLKFQQWSCFPNNELASHTWKTNFYKNEHTGMIGNVHLRDRLNTENFVDYKNIYIF